MSSETAQFRDQVVQYCQGNGIDIGSGADPVVPWAIQIDLPTEQFNAYGHAFSGIIPVQWRGDGTKDLPFRDAVMDFVYSSHLIEDYLDWTPLLTEWIRVLKPGGYLILLLPDKAVFNECVRLHGGGNANHKHEGRVGELTEIIQNFGRFEVIRDSFGNDHPLCYNIVFVAKKL